MPRIRTIKPEFFTHEELAGTSAHARLLAIGLLTLADCKGRLRWVPMLVHAQVFPWEATVKIEVLLGELTGIAYCVHYEIDGKRYVEIVNFLKHQRLSGKEAGYESRLPEPPEMSGIAIRETGEGIGKHAGASQGSARNPLGTGEHRNLGTEEHRNLGTEDLSLSEKVGRNEKTESFERFWEAYPKRRRTKKQDARKCWDRSLAKVDAATLITRAVEYAASDQGQSEFAVMPSVWLNSGMWEDGPEAWTRGTSSGPVTFAQQRIANTKQAIQDFCDG